MSEQSAKPYLVRAICEWCADNGLTPYLAVKVDGRTRVPTAYVKNGEIVLNVSATATRKLTVDNDGVRFNARFSGVSQEVSVPMTAVAGIFAKETGYGFAFAVPSTEEAGAPLATVPLATVPSVPEPAPDAPGTGGTRNGKADDKAKPRPSHLQVIK
jgi:stringent starvation protein B